MSLMIDFSSSSFLSLKVKINVTKKRPNEPTNKRMSFAKTNANSNACVPNPITVLMSFEIYKKSNENEREKKILGKFFYLCVGFCDFNRIFQFRIKSHLPNEKKKNTTTTPVERRVIAGNEFILLEK